MRAQIWVRKWNKKQKKEKYNIRSETGCVHASAKRKVLTLLRVIAKERMC